MARFVTDQHSTYYPAIGQVIRFWYGHWCKDPGKPRSGSELVGSVVGVQMRTGVKRAPQPHLFVWVPTWQRLVRIQMRFVTGVVRDRPKRRGPSYRTVWIRRELALNCGKLMHYGFDLHHKLKVRSLADLLDRPIVLDPAHRRVERGLYYVEVQVHASWWVVLDHLRAKCAESLLRVEQAAHELRANLPELMHGLRQGVDLGDRFSYDGRPLTGLVERLNRSARSRPCGRAPEPVLPKGVEFLYGKRRTRS
jgi:hypothetical protein